MGSQSRAFPARRRCADGDGGLACGLAAFDRTERGLSMYVAVKGGEGAIENAHRLLDHKRRGDTSVPDLSVAQIREQMTLLVDRVMTEGSLYDPDLAALAI